MSTMETLEFPFTRAEMLSGLALAFPREQAAAMADDICAAAKREAGWSLTFETLALFSLASAELERKVDELRARLVPALDLARWTEMRESMRQAVSERRRS